MNISKIFVLCIVLAIAAPSKVDAALIVFGDSLSDEGNVRKASVDAGLVPDPPIPPYDANGRMSNGPIWVDYLADSLNLDRPTASLLPGGTAYAYAGALTGSGQTPRQSVTLAPFGINQVQSVDNVGLQITHYSNSHPGGFASNDLVLLWAGANDLAVATIAALTTMNLAIGQAIVDNAIVNLQNRLTTLNSLGAEKVVVPNQLNASVAPFWNAPYRSPAIPAIGAQVLLLFTDDFNSKLAAMLTSLENTPGFNTHIIDVDLASAFKDFAALGFSETTDPFLFDVTPPAVKNPSDYVFWDLIHPTTRAHELIAASVLAAVVPEPSGAGLLLAGIVVLALLRRRRPAMHFSTATAV